MKKIYNFTENKNKIIESPYMGQGACRQIQHDFMSNFSSPNLL